MRRNIVRRLAMAACAAGAMTIASAAQATEILHTFVNAGPPPAMPTGEPSLELIAEPFMININLNPNMEQFGGVPGWHLVNAPNNLVFETTFDPTAGPIHKLLKSPNGGDFQADDDPSTEPRFDGMGFSTTFLLLEVIVVGQNSAAFTDWHERILTPGWEWSGAQLDITFPSGQMFSQDGAGMIMGPDIWFFFDEPLPPGSVIGLQKFLQYVGLDDPQTGMTEIFNGQVEIIEWPTVPAPAALPAALMLLGAMGLVRRRRAPST